MNTKVAWCVFAFALSMAASAQANNDLSTAYRPGTIEPPDVDSSPNNESTVAINQGRPSYQLSIVGPPGRENMEPSLALTFTGQRFETMVGAGWSLTYPSVRVRLSGRGGQPDFGTAVRYLGLNGEELIETDTLSDIDGDGTDESVYFEERNTTYARYVQLSDGGWRIDLPNGIKIELGINTNNRIVRSDALDPNFSSHIVEWLPETQFDPHGNEMTWTWKTPSEIATDIGSTSVNTVQRYLSEVRYGCTSCTTASHYQSIEIEYAALSGHIFDFSPGFLVETEFYVAGISTHSTARAAPIRSYTLSYDTSDTKRILTSVAVAGDDGKSLPTVTFTYTDRNAPTVDTTVTNTPTVNFESGVEPVDIDFDGRIDVADLSAAGGGTGDYFRNTGNGAASFASSTAIASLPPVSIGSANDDASAEDATRDTGIDVFDLGSSTIYAHNRSDGWDRSGIGATLPAVAISTDVVRFDINADGYNDLIDTAVSPWYVYLDDGSHTYTADSYQLTADTTPTFGASVLSAATDGVLFGDVNGDGLTDVIYLEIGATNDYAHVFFGRGRDGFGLLEDEDRTGVNWNAMYVTYTIHSSAGEPDPATSLLADIDGDGLADLVTIDDTDDRVRVWQRMPGGGFTDDNTSSPLTQTISTTEGCRVADWDADSVSEILCSDDWTVFDWADQRPYLLHTVDNGRGMVTTLRYDTTAHFAAAHEAAGDAWNTQVSMAMPVVAEHEIDDSRGVVLVVEYDYRDAYMELDELEDRFGFTGFGYISTVETAYIETTIGDATTRIEDPRDPGAHHRKWYDVGDTNYFDRGATICEETWDRQSNPAGFDCTVGASGPMVRIAYEYSSSDADNDGVHIFKLEAQDRYILESGAQTAVRIREEYEYDDFGNRTAFREYGTYSGTPDSTGNDERMVEMTYINNTEDWLVQLPRLVRQGTMDFTTNPPSLQAIDESCTVYDGVANLCPPATYDATRDDVLVTAGLATKVVRYLDDNLADAAPGAWETVNETTYTTKGLRDVVTDAEGHDTDHDYDADFGLFETRTAVDPLGLNFVNTYTVDPIHGLPTQQVLPDGTINEAEYDDLGRLTKLWRNSDIGSSPSLTRSYTLSSPLSYVTDTVKRNGLLKFRIQHAMDGAGRMVCRLEDRRGLIAISPFTRATVIPVIPVPIGTLPTLTGRDIVRFEYTARGNKAIEFRPYNSSGCGNPTYDSSGRSFDQAHDLLTYDAQNRVTERRHIPDDEYITTTYGVLTVTVNDEKDNSAATTYTTPSTSRYDGLGQVVEIIENVDTNGDGITEALNLSYGYDSFGRLTSVVNDNGDTLWTADYDSRGRLVQEIDASRGAATMTYDDLDRMLVRTDARGHTVTHAFDAAGRVTSVVSDDGAGGAPAETRTYTYDAHPDSSQSTPCHSVGKLVRVEDASGQTTFCHDDEGRVVQYETVIDAYSTTTPLVTTRTFTVDGHLETLTYPDGSEISYTYQAGGRPSSATITSPSGDSYKVITSATYEAGGRLTKLNYGNGATTDVGYDDRGRITSIDTTLTSTPGLSLTQTYDPVGNTISVTDAIGHRSMTYTYDDLNRLASAAGDGVQSQTLTYSYDDSGNLLSRISTDSSSSLYLANAAYAGAASTDPLNALTSVDFDGDGVIDEQFSYDDVGNLAEDGSHAFKFGPRGYLREVETRAGVVVSEYTYDYRDRRVVSSYPGTSDAVYFVRPGETEIRDIDGVETERKYIKFGSKVVGVIEGTFTSTTIQEHVFLYGFDLTGSPALVMNATTALDADTVIERYANYPFGAENGEATIAGYLEPTDASSKLSRRFQGREVDWALPNLYDFSARTYRPDLARFMSADAIIPDASSSQQWNRYAFVGNNPLRYDDTTGHFQGYFLGWVVLSSLCDACAGYYDELTFGFTELGREHLEIDHKVDVTSDAYKAGGWIGFGASVGIGGSKAVAEEVFDAVLFYESDAFAAPGRTRPGPGRMSPARYIVGISTELERQLRKMTPNRALRVLVSQGRSPPYPDPAVKGLSDWTLVPDHVVPFSEIVRMPGFPSLSATNKRAILNWGRNFIGLTGTTNSSRGDKSWAVWAVHKVTGLEVDPKFAEKMWRKEMQLRYEIAERIQEMLTDQGLD